MSFFLSFFLPLVSFFQFLSPNFHSVLDKLVHNSLYAAGTNVACKSSQGCHKAVAKIYSCIFECVLLLPGHKSNTYSLFLKIQKSIKKWGEKKIIHNVTTQRSNHYSHFGIFPFTHFLLPYCLYIWAQMFSPQLYVPPTSLT